MGLVDTGWLSDNIIRRVGDGRDTLFWVDPWLDDCPLARSFDRLYYLADNKLATVSQMFELGWGLEVRRGSGVGGYFPGRKS